MTEPFKELIYQQLWSIHDRVRFAMIDCVELLDDKSKTVHFLSDFTLVVD